VDILQNSITILSLLFFAFIKVVPQKCESFYFVISLKITAEVSIAKEA